MEKCKITVNQTLDDTSHRVCMVIQPIRKAILGDAQNPPTNVYLCHNKQGIGYEGAKEQMIESLDDIIDALIEFRIKRIEELY